MDGDVVVVSAGGRTARIPYSQAKSPAEVGVEGLGCRVELWWWWWWCQPAFVVRDTNICVWGAFCSFSCS